MKTYRIAILLIVFSLGFNFIPRAYTLNITDDTTSTLKKKKVSSEFKGVRISVVPLDEILFMNANSDNRISNKTPDHTIEKGEIKNSDNAAEDITQANCSDKQQSYALGQNNKSCHRIQSTLNH